MTKASGRPLVMAALMLLSASTSSVAELVRVEVKDLVFSPAEITARVGDTIEWVNRDFIAHTATGKDEGWDVMLEPGKTGRVQVRKIGTIDYFCRFHPNMTGRVSVIK